MEKYKDDKSKLCQKKQQSFYGLSQQYHYFDIVVCDKKEVCELSGITVKKMPLPEGWNFAIVSDKEIVVSHVDGSGVLIRKDAKRIAEQLFYRMMDQILKGGE